MGWFFDQNDKCVYLKTTAYKEVQNIENLKQIKSDIVDSMVQFLFKVKRNTRIKLFTPVKRINDYEQRATSCETLAEMNVYTPERLLRIE